MGDIIKIWIRYSKGNMVTTILIVLNLLMFFVAVFTGGFSILNLEKLGALVPIYVMNDQEYYRILTAMFLHGGIIHLAMNMYVLYNIGKSLERKIGSLKYGILYFVSGIGSGLFVVLLEKDYSVTVGASGAIFGLIGALLYLTYARKNWFTPMSIQSIRWLVVINLAFTLLIPNVSVSGHIGGFIVGGVLMFLLVPKKPYSMRNYKEYYQGGEVVGDGDPTIVS